jgi:hypothetical protein
MVNNTNYPLNEGKVFFLCPNIMEPAYYYKFMETLSRMRTIHQDVLRDRPTDDLTREDIDTYRIFGDNEGLRDMLSLTDTSLLKSNNTTITTYMKVKPFRTSVMINISPNWKGKVNLKGPAGTYAIKRFRAVIENYLNAGGRYTNYKYALECGGEGNFLHAHIVAEINHKLEKSVVSHFNRGNHQRDLQKEWNKQFKGTDYSVEGKEGLLRGKYAVQRILIRKQNILEDKLEYLKNDTKPVGHENKYDLGILVGDFNFTAK